MSRIPFEEPTQPEDNHAYILWRINLSRIPFEEPTQPEDNHAPDLGESPIPSLGSIPGMTPDDFRQFFQAAADYYRLAPWESLSDTQPLRLFFDPPSKEGFVQLMGYAGVQYGLLLYWEWEDLLETYKGAQEPLDSIPPDGWKSFTFEENEMLPEDDLKAIMDNGWEIAGENAYPLPLNFGADELQRPTRQEMVFYEAALRAIPVFVDEALEPNGQDDFHPAEGTYQIGTFDGTISVTLSYPAGEIPLELLAEADAGTIHFFEEPPEFDPDEEDDLGYEGALEKKTDPGDIPERPGQADPGFQHAQRLVEAAYNQQDPAERIALANEALETSPDCSEAFFLLAEEAQSIEEAYDLYQQALLAAERRLGVQWLENHAGQLWRWREARPYLRTRQEMAACLSQMGQPLEALGHYRELLRLNPQDNQGIRYAALALLMAQGDHQAVQALLEAYPQEGFAAWPFTRALLSFRLSGDSRQARMYLAKALAYNPHVRDFLTGRKALPVELPEYIGFGDESEAMHYVSEHYPNWWGTQDAITWLKSAPESR